jgi:phosphatidate cytidylyltransferase
VSGAAAPVPSSELRKRVLSGLVMGLAAIGATIWGGWPFFLLWMLAAAAVADEWQRMAHGAGASFITGLAVAATLLAGFAAWSGDLSTLGIGVFSLLFMALLGVAVWLSRPELRSVTATGLLYAGAFAAGIILCRSRGYDGAVVVLWLFASVWGTDILAYFTGRALGGPKLWPRVSPKKTWSGAIGGLAGGVLLGAVLLLLAGVSLRWQHVALAAVFSILTQLGDLYESAMKRRFGVKDSGRLIPGHGGFMDRLDGFIVAVVFAAAFGALRSGPSQVPAGLLVWP